MLNIVCGLSLYCKYTPTERQNLGYILDICSWMMQCVATLASISTPSMWTRARAPPMGRAAVTNTRWAT